MSANVVRLAFGGIGSSPLYVHRRAEPPVVTGNSVGTGQPYGNPAGSAEGTSPIAATASSLSNVSKCFDTCAGLFESLNSLVLRGFQGVQQ
jgi:hypothetical protein